MSVIKFDDDFGSIPSKTYTNTCHFCQKTFESWCDYSDLRYSNMEDLLPACEECMVVKPCGVNDHKLWVMTLDCGSVSFDCKDKCSREDASRMKGYGGVCRGPGGDWSEYTFGEFNVKVNFDKGTPDWETGIYDDFSFDVTLRTLQDDCTHGEVRPAIGAWCECVACGKTMTDAEFEAHGA